MMYYNGFYPQSHFFFGPIISIIFWIILISIIIRISRRIGHHPHSHDHHNNRAMDILKERYAKGEITKEQFEEMKKDLH